MKRRLPLIVTATLIAALLCVALCSCARRDTLYDLSYDSSAYTAKESVEAEGIASLDIEWFAGEVRFERTEDAKLGASERGAGKRGELYKGGKRHAVYQMRRSRQVRAYRGHGKDAHRTRSRRSFF